MRHTTNQPKCKKCKHNPVARSGMVCNSCRVRRPPAPTRAAIVPMWARILAVRDAGTFRADAPRLVTTADVLALRNESLLSASPEAFEVAADLAQKWNEFLAVQS